MLLTYDPEADALYIEFRDAEVARTLSLDADRNVDYDLDGVVVGVEFLNMRDGWSWRACPGARRYGGTRCGSHI